jgi:antitoxin VapB
MVYIRDRSSEMSTAKTAKLFRNGRSQAVRLPREFRFEGNEVRIRQLGVGVLLEPMISDAPQWFDELDRFKSERFMKKGSRNQPRTPRRKIFE